MLKIFIYVRTTAKIWRRTEKDNAKYDWLYDPKIQRQTNLRVCVCALYSCTLFAKSAKKATPQLRRLTDVKVAIGSGHWALTHAHSFLFNDVDGKFQIHQAMAS